MATLPFEKGWADKIYGRPYNATMYVGDMQAQYKQGYDLAVPLEVRRVEDVKAANA